MIPDAEQAGPVTQVRRPRFIAPMPSIRAGAGAWRKELRRIEDLGFDEVAVSEHYSQGWAMEPLTALAFAAASVPRLRFLTLVLNNDLRHPAILAKAIATADVLSDGRVTLGIGAGWLPADYTALGIPFDPAGTRIARLEEGIRVIRAFFAGGETKFNGTFYETNELESLPGTVQQPGPPILVGAGGPRMLDLAGRMADIVGIHVAMSPNGFDLRAAREMSATAIESKIARVRESARAAARSAPTFEFTPIVVIIDAKRSTSVRPGFSDYIESHPAEFAESPAVLVGTARQVADSVKRWSEELGIEFWHLGPDIEAVARVVSAANR